MARSGYKESQQAPDSYPYVPSMILCLINLSQQLNRLGVTMALAVPSDIEAVIKFFSSIDSLFLTLPGIAPIGNAMIVFAEYKLNNSIHHPITQLSLFDTYASLPSVYGQHVLRQRRLLRSRG